MAAFFLVYGVGCTVYGVRLATRMRLVVGGGADAPEVSLEGLLAVSIIFLCEEVLLVGVDIHQVLFACLNGCSDSCEASACPELIAVRSCAAVVSQEIK